MILYMRQRLSDTYEQIISLDNLRLAVRNASKNKPNKRYITAFKAKNVDDCLLLELQRQLREKTFRVSMYHSFKVMETKERDIASLPYYPDRIVQHAIVNILGDYWLSIMSKHSYSCIKERGVLGKNGLYKHLVSALRCDVKGTQYALKQDMRHYFQSIDHNILKNILSEQIADKDTMWLLCLFIDSISTGEREGVGIAIGSLLSQYFANLYLGKFDWFVKNKLKARYYFRYNDDIVFLAESKDELHRIFEGEQDEVRKLGLTIKKNWQIFPIEKRGIDIGGFVFFHSYVKIRKRIKENFRKKLKTLHRQVTDKEFMQMFCGWFGYIKHSNSINLCNCLVEDRYINLVTKYF